MEIGDLVAIADVYDKKEKIVFETPKPLMITSIGITYHCVFHDRNTGNYVQIVVDPELLMPYRVVYE